MTTYVPTTWDRIKGIYLLGAWVVGALSGVITFIWVYILAVGYSGWVVGIALGWFPAGLAALAAFFVCGYLWPLITFVVIFGGLKIAFP